jgi:hypothetical protein
MNHPTALTSQRRGNYEVNPCRRSVGLQDLIEEEEEDQNENMVNGLVHIRHSQQVTQFIFAEPTKLLKLPQTSPPPKLHYSTWWRSITRRLYEAKTSSGKKK